MGAPADIASQLLREREMFLAFVQKRVQDPEMAADIVQDSFVKAIKSAGHLRDKESVVAWFYRILRRAIIDAYRRRDAGRRALDAFEAEAAVTMTAEDERTLCGCLRLLIPTLKAEYAEVIDRVELQGEPMEKVANELKLSASNLRVRLHRGRKQLQERLEQTCRVCAKHGCLDCKCDTAPR